MTLQMGSVLLGARPQIAAILERGIDKAELKALHQQGVDVLELRVDSFEGGVAGAETFLNELDSIWRQRFALLLTIRETEALRGETRLAAFQRLTPLVDAIDVEFEASDRERLAQVAHSAGRLALLSTHDFENAPGDEALAAVIAEARRLRAAAAKIAVFVGETQDLQRLFRLLTTTQPLPLIVIAMGEIGMISRLAAPFLGSLYTYGYLERPNAPGQLSVAELNELLLRFSPDYRAAMAARRTEL